MVAVEDDRVRAIGPDALQDVVKAYVTRYTTEDLDVLVGLGGLEGLARGLRVDPSLGVSTKSTGAELWSSGNPSLAARAEYFGRNEMPKKALTGFFRLVWEASRDPMLRVLMVASIVSIVLGVTFGERPEIEWIEGAAIFLAVCIVITVTACNDFFKERQFSNLLEQEVKEASVFRDSGVVRKIPTHQLVVGDIVQLETGDEIPADCIVINHFSLKVDESSLTGESVSIAKASLKTCLEDREKKKEAFESKGRELHHLVSSPVLLAGTTVTSGSATAMVVAVGTWSQVGHLYAKLAVDTEPTPLQNKLNALARDVGRAGFFAAVLTLVVLMSVYWIGYFNDSPQDRNDGSEIAEAMVEFVVTAITIVVVAVPEGLPLAVTISLAFSVNRMLKDQNYVRKLAACETMGGADQICSDKTGTLTKNQMEVEGFWNGSMVTNDVKSESSREDFVPKGEHLVILMVNIAVNSTAYLEKETIEMISGQNREVTKQIGSATECALLQFAEVLGFDTALIRQMFGGQRPLQQEILEPMKIHSDLLNGLKDFVVLRIPFSSDRKAMTTIIVHPTDPKLLRAFIKGAAEIVLSKCSHRLDKNGNLVLFPEAKKQKIEDLVITEFASLALRTICLGYRDFNPSDIPEWNTKHDPGNELFLDIEHNFTCLGIAGVRDPIREEVPSAVEICMSAGVKVRMCTGDNLDTAKQIALKANIFHPEEGGLAMLGRDFYEFVGGIVCELCKSSVCGCEGGGGPQIREDAASSSKQRRLQTRNANESTTQDDNNSHVQIPVDTSREGDSRCAKGCGSVICNCVTLSLMKKQRGSSSNRLSVEPVPKRVDAIGNLDAFRRIANNLEVLARSQPNDKYALVTGLKQLGHVVAVTGDGTNDAPALKKADVGFAMGITGKEVAKQAADIVLLDDNFESIVRSIKWGRNIYDNIQRFLQFQLTVNIVAVATAFIGAVLLRHSPLSAVQLLWVNLIMDTFAALALATELPNDRLLQRQPHTRTEYLVSKAMTRNIVVQAIYQIGVLVAMIFSGECWLPEFDFSYDKSSYPDFSPFSQTCGGGTTVRSGRPFKVFSNEQDYKAIWYREIGPSRHLTYVFNVFVIMQLFNLVNARKLGIHEFGIFNGVFTNKYWIAVMLVIITGQALMVQLGGYAVSVHPDGLTWQQWLMCLCFGLGCWVVALVAKLLPESFVERLPETANKEVDVMEGPPTIALASRGRIDTDRWSHRLLQPGPQTLLRDALTRELDRGTSLNTTTINPHVRTSSFVDRGGRHAF